MHPRKCLGSENPCAALNQLQFTSPEVNFKGFGAVGDISIMGDISIEAVTDEVPHQFLQDEDLR